MTPKRGAVRLTSTGFAAVLAAATACTGLQSGGMSREPGSGPPPPSAAASGGHARADVPPGGASTVTAAPSERTSPPAKPATPPGSEPDPGGGPGPERSGVSSEGPGGTRLETIPAGAEVYLDGEFLGKTPMKLPAQLPEHGMFTFLAPGYQPLYYFMNPGDAPRQVELTPLPPSPAGEALDRLRALRDGLRWEVEPTRWSLQLPVGSAPRWLPSPDGERVVVVLRSQAQGEPSRAASESLVLLHPARRERRVLAEQPLFPTRGHNTHESPTAGFFPVGWRDTRRFVVFRTTFTDADGNPARPSIVAEEYDVDRGTAHRLAALPAVVRPIDFEAAWVTDRYAYLSTGTLYGFDLEAGSVRAVRRNMPVFEPSGTVPLTISPDGTRVLYGLYGQGLLRAETGEDLPFLPAGMEPGGGSWSPDGRLLALRVRGRAYPGHWLQGEDAGFLLAGAVRVVDRDGREVATLTLPADLRSADPGAGAFISELRWLPDASGLVVRAVRTDPVEVESPDAWMDASVQDAGLFLLPLSGSPSRIRDGHGESGQMIAVGINWVLESRSTAGTSPTPQVTRWGRAGAPPLPPESFDPVAALVTSAGDLIVVARSGTVWRCAPGSDACEKTGRFGSAGWPTAHGRWIIQVDYGRGLEGLKLDR